MLEYKEIILIDEEYLNALLRDIDNAKNSIDLEVYTFANDTTGQIVADALCKSAQKGVKVRILIDGVGSINWGGKIAEQMEKAGIKIKIFHPLPWNFLHWHRANYLPTFFIKKIGYLLAKANSRNHRKSCNIDNNIVYVGSANINDHLSGKSKWRDTTVRLINVNTNVIQYAFNKAWHHFSFRKNIQNFFKKLNGEKIFQLNYSLVLRYKNRKKLIKRILNAKNRIWVTNSYFIPSSRLLKKLAEASAKGIDVRILLPEKSDVFFMSVASRTFYSALLESGVLIYEYTPTILHAKTLIIDDYYMVGSSNLNNRSFLHDLEIDVNLQTDKAKEDIEKKFFDDLNQSKQINYEDIKKQSIFAKIFGHIILLLKHWL